MVILATQFIFYILSKMTVKVKSALFNPTIGEKMNPLFSPESHLYPRRIFTLMSDPPVAIIKALLIGTSPGLSLANNDVDKSMRETIHYLLQLNNLPTEKVSLSTLANLIDEDLSSLPLDILHQNDYTLQANGEIICWPPQTSDSRSCALLPPYLNWPGTGRKDGHISTGAAIFYVKCLFRKTTFFSGYPINNIFCEKLAETIAKFQKGNGLDCDSSFGPATRRAFNDRYECDLDAIPRSILYGEKQLGIVLKN